MAAESLERVRRFNRTVTQRVGALNDRFLSRDRPLGEARMLWEIGLEECEVRTLRNRLELDSGHASRLLRSLAAAGLVEVTPSAGDRRVRVARLTPAGREERAFLDARSDELAQSLLTRLQPGQRDRLLDAMGEVERLLTAASVELRAVDPATPDARQCFRAYFAELERRSPPGFEVDACIPVEPEELRPPAGCLLIAHLRHEPVACGGVKHLPGKPAEIKRMWVSPAIRGLGLGRRLLGELETRAARSGATTVRLETNHVLTEAISLYSSVGYRRTKAFNDEPFADRWFEKRL